MEAGIALIQRGLRNMRLLTHRAEPVPSPPKNTPPKEQQLKPIQVQTGLKSQEAESAENCSGPVQVPLGCPPPTIFRICKSNLCKRHPGTRSSPSLPSEAAGDRSSTDGGPGSFLIPVLLYFALGTVGGNVNNIPVLRSVHARLHDGQTRRDSIGEQFPASTSHRCHHKQKQCMPVPQCSTLPISPLLFHPHAKGAQIVMDTAQKWVKRQASFCNAITFTNRPVVIYEQVRLKITKKQCCWSGALRLGFTSKDPSRINPDTLPKYACPDLVSQTGFWAKALPEEFANEGNVIAFWVDKKGRVFYRINDSVAMLFFSGVRTTESLWALIDVYGLTRGVQLLDSEFIPPDCLRPRSFTAIRRPSLRRENEDTRLSVSLCDLNLQENYQVMSTLCPIPQNSLNSQHCHLLPAQLESDLRFHPLRGAHIKTLDDQTVARLEHTREERTLVFTSRPLRINETIFIKINKSNASRAGTLSYGVTSCDPSTLRPSDLPYNPESLVDRKEFWAVCRVTAPLQSGDILGFVVNSEGELHLSHNGASVGMQVCVDSSQPLWMFFGLHGAIMQIRILGSTLLADHAGPSTPNSPTSGPNSPLPNDIGGSDPVLYAPRPKCTSINGTAPNSPVSISETGIAIPITKNWSDECTICYENLVDTVIYSCGHMCLCYTCGLKLKRMDNACCPICRRAIKDIIKTYRSS